MDFKTIISFFHLLATVIWIGGMAYFILILSPSLIAIEPPQREKLTAMAAKRFAITAWICILVLIITGLLMTPKGIYFNLHETFGLLINIKILLFIIMLVVGIIVATVLFPIMKKLSPKPGEKPSAGFIKIQKRMSLLALINLILGILILLIMSFI